MSNKLIVTVFATATRSADVTNEHIAKIPTILRSAEKQGTLPTSPNTALIFNVDGEKVKVYEAKSGLNVVFSGLPTVQPKNQPLELDFDDAGEAAE